LHYDIYLDVVSLLGKALAEDWATPEAVAPVEASAVRALR
jgi:hypothetical protein